LRPVEERRGGWKWSLVSTLLETMAGSSYYGFEPNKSVSVCAGEREGEGDQREDLGLPVLDNFVVGGRN
jgi:hypothetical protein